MADLSDMLTYGSAYKQKMKDFQKSPLYPYPYKPLIRLLYQNIGRALFSKTLETRFGITDRQVRDITEHARRCGHMLASGADGYWIETDYEKLCDICKPLEEQIFARLWTLRRMLKICRKGQQTALRLVSIKKAA